MYFNFEDDRPDTPAIAKPLSAREGVLISIVLHLLFVIALLVAPTLPFVQAAEERRQQALEEQRRRELQRMREDAAARRALGHGPSRADARARTQSHEFDAVFARQLIRADRVAAPS
jgi:hypothetical protein